MALTPTIITAHDLPELWYRALWYLFHQEEKRDYLVQHGSFENQHRRREFDYFFGHVTSPSSDNMVPIIPEGLSIPAPTDRIHIDRYFEEYIIGEEMKPGESYTYGSRINLSLDKAIEMLRKTPNTNQACIEIADPMDTDLKEPPCLRLIDCRVKDEKLHFIVYFRSWDLYAGLPENLGGLQLLKEYMASEIGVADGEMIVHSKGAHVYDYVWPQVAELVRFTKSEVN